MPRGPRKSPPAKQRFHVYLSTPSLARLDAVVAATGLPAAEHLRRALDLYLESFEPLPAHSPNRGFSPQEPRR